jgi:hypothetical protein
VGTPFFGARDTKKGALIFWRTGKKYSAERRIVMKMLCLLYNLRAHTVGINQIKNVFMKQLDVNANNEFDMM